MERRTFLQSSTALAMISGLSKPSWAATPHFADDPFTLGVASGEPSPYGMTLWTRLAPKPLDPDGGVDAVPVAVAFEIADNETLASPIATGEAIAVPEMAHSVRVRIDGLSPGRHYWYRFTVGDAESPIGRTKTLPDPQSSIQQVRFATTSCQHYEQGLFVAYDHMVEDDVDFALHLGDYIYGVSRGDFRNHTRKDKPVTLEDYRLRHALYKTDPHLQRAHASFPFFTVMDNHDSLKDVEVAPQALAQRAAAYQAWFEHMPMMGGYTPGSTAIYTHGATDFGDLLRLNILDTRQFRDDEDICREFADPDYGFTIYRPACDPAVEAARSMLGEAQEAWISRQLWTSKQKWNAIGSTVLFSPFAMQHKGDTFRYESSWDYYPGNRKRLLTSIAESGVANPMVLSADIHSNWAIDIKADPESPESETIGSELLATSLASGWPPPLDQPMKDNLGNNPHVHHYRGDERGYLLHEVTVETWSTDMRVIDDVQSAKAKSSSQARFVVENGRPGVQKA